VVFTPPVAIFIEHNMKTRAKVRKESEKLLETMGLKEEEISWWIDSTVIASYNKTPQELIDDGRGEELLARLICLAQGNIGS